MKLIPILLSTGIFCLIIFFTQCSKKVEPPPDIPPVDTTAPPPVTPIDSLSNGWTITYHDTADIYDVFFNHKDTGYLVSAKGISKSNDGGLHWFNTGNPKEQGSFLFVTPDGKIFYSSYNKLYCSIDAGQSFFVSAENSIYDMYFVSPSIGYLPSPNRLRITKDGGNTWNDVSNLTGNGWGQYSIPFFIDENTGWIGSTYGVFRSVDSVNTWEKSSFDVNPNLISGAIVHAVSADSVFASIGGQVYRSEDGGNYFKLVFKEGNIDNFNDIFFIDSQEGYYLANNSIYQTKDGGNTWQRVVRLADGILTELHFKDRNHGWAVGRKGIVLNYRK